MIKISLLNIKARKIYFIHLLLEIAVVSSIIILWICLSISLRKNNERYINENYSLCNLSVNLELDGLGNITENNNYRIFNKVSEWDNISDPSIIAYPNIPELVGKENWIFVNVDNVYMQIDEQNYYGNNDFSFNFGTEEDEDSVRKAVRFNLGILYNDSFYNKNDLAEFNYRYPNENVILYGNSKPQDGEVLISDYMLERFGISNDMQSLLGKEITFYIDNDRFGNQYRIAGIINSKLYRCSNLSDIPQIILGKNALKDIPAYKAEAIFPADSFVKLPKLFEKAEKEGLGINILLWDIIDTYYILDAAKNTLNKVVTVFGLLIIIAVLLNMYNILLRNIESMKTVFGLYQAIGMTKIQTIKIFIMQILFVTFVSITVSSVLSAFVLRIASKTMTSFVGVTITSDIKDYFLSILAATLMVLIVIAVFAFTKLAIFFSKQPAILLKKNS